MNKRIIKREKLPFLLGNIPVLLSCIDAWQQNDYLYLLISLIIFILNIFVLIFVKNNFNQLSFLINSFLFFFLSYYYYELGRSSLPYACFVLGIGYLGAIVIYNKKVKKRDLK